MWGFWTLLLVLVLLIVALPVYPYSRGWGYWPSGLLLVLFLFWILLLYLGAIAFWWPWAPPAGVVGA
ncbi:DUF3309 family protein [Aquibium sp. A9E412]|uniref:DUF3309 family protein n=1 Tax=Aquibium sp. A9E412 TaxID=2976767 RepID=UPI0025B055F9|nr:DUF3309 family protein [Aquibium sp. A9E412]MDN2568147.1 DUF3309 family protein [Aquibium sp. A9E412]